MREIPLTAIAITILFSFGACKKNDSPSSARTVQNLSGSYVLTSLIWTSNGISANVYDSLPACEKDNIMQLLTDGTAHEIDGKVKCDPPEADTVITWNLSANGDSLYFGDLGTFIKSWDGKTLVYTGIVWGAALQVTGTTTLVKQ